MSNNEKELNQAILFRFVKEDGQEINVGPLTDKQKIVIVINNQITTAPNTTQIASGAGHNSAAGNNAAIDSSNTKQQQSVGAEGKAYNSGMSGDQIEPHKEKDKEYSDPELEFILVINNQVNSTSKEQAGATQVASGGGNDSGAGTNAAIESSNTEQQHSVGGGGTADNSGENGNQTEE